MSVQLGMFDTQTATAQQETQPFVSPDGRRWLSAAQWHEWLFGAEEDAEEETLPPASLTLRQYCKSCRRAPAVQCDKCRTWRKNYKSVRACLLSRWPTHYRHADSVTLRLSGPFGDFAETGTERHIREYRSLLCMAGVAQEVVWPNG